MGAEPLFTGHALDFDRGAVCVIFEVFGKLLFSAPQYLQNWLVANRIIIIIIIILSEPRKNGKV